MATEYDNSCIIGISVKKKKKKKLFSFSDQWSFLVELHTTEYFIMIKMSFSSINQVQSHAIIRE
jgi:hypothetical protein